MSDGGGTDAPLYRQIKQLVLGKIGLGEWRIGAQVPTEQELVATLGVSRMTVCRALNELTSEGILTRKSGVGTFVAKKPDNGSRIEIKDISDEIAERGGAHSSQVLALERRSATEFLTERMGIPRGSDVYYSRILHFANGEPVQLEERWINPSFALDYLNQDFSRITPQKYLSSCTLATEFEQSIYAVLPRESECQVLAIARESPCLLITRRLWSGKAVVSTDRFLSPGNRHSLGSRYLMPH